MSYAARKGLNRNQIKYVAIIAMLIDHIAWGELWTRFTPFSAR